eukprot:3599293-Pyramimonas_sp.AAC.1
MSFYPRVLSSCPRRACLLRQGDRREVIRNTDPLRGRVGTNLAGVLLYVIGITVACPVSSDTVVRSDWELSVAKGIGERNPDRIVACTSSSNHSLINDCSYGLAR